MMRARPERSKSMRQLIDGKYRDLGSAPEAERTRSGASRNEPYVTMRPMNWAATAAVIAAMLLTAIGHATGGEAHTVPERQEGSLPSMSKFYTGGLEQIGTFPGTLVCLRCDLGIDQHDSRVCEKRGHRHALSMDGGTMVHPLVAGTEDVLSRINSTELHGKKVRVTGKYYPSTGIIFVGSIAASE